MVFQAFPLVPLHLLFPVLRHPQARRPPPRRVHPPSKRGRQRRVGRARDAFSSPGRFFLPFFSLESTNIYLKTLRFTRQPPPRRVHPPSNEEDEDGLETRLEHPGMVFSFFFSFGSTNDYLQLDYA